MAIDLGTSATIVLGWLHACEILAAYAASPPEFEHDAIDEEQAGNEAARRSTLPVLQARLQARVDAHDANLAGAVKCPVCLENCQSRGVRKRSWASTLGDVELWRRWSWCETDKCGVSDAQRWLRLPDGPRTAQLDEVISRVATTVSHGMAVELLSKLLGVQVSEHGVQNVVEARAVALTALQDAEAIALNPQHADGSERQAGGQRGQECGALHGKGLRARERSARGDPGQTVRVTPGKLASFQAATVGADAADAV